MEDMVQTIINNFKQDNEKLYESLNMKIDTGIEILEILFSRYDKKKIHELSNVLKDVSDTNKDVLAVIYVLLNGLCKVTTDVNNVMIESYKKRDPNLPIPLKEMVRGFSQAIQLLTTEVQPKSVEELNIFFITLSVVAKSGLVDEKHIINFIDSVCKDNKYALEDILEGFFMSYAFYANMIEDVESSCTECSECSCKDGTSGSINNIH